MCLYNLAYKKIESKTNNKIKKRTSATELGLTLFIGCSTAIKDFHWLLDNNKEIEKNKFSKSLGNIKNTHANF